MTYANSLTPSTNISGMIGLNTIPSARMDKAGTLRMGLSEGEPYEHAFIGFQIAKPLYINLRQTIQTETSPLRAYPGIDVKLRVANESRYRPEIALGMNSMLGHRKFSSEYLALSKRYYDFDFTGGIAWGRMGSAGHIKNPFGAFTSHLGKDRNLNDENAATPSDWFSGEQAGFFGGVEYHTPLNGLSLKADFNADNYVESNTDKASPWTFGLNYSPKDWVSFGAAITGTEKIMARFSLQGNVFGWGGKSHKTTDIDNNSRIKNRDIQIDGEKITGILHLNDYEPSPLQIGRAAKSLLSKATPEVKTIVITPMSDGTKGASMTFSRRDLQPLNLKPTASPEEIWHNLEFNHKEGIDFSKASERKYKILPELSFSLGEEETTFLYRTALTVEEKKNWGHGFITGNTVRLNLADNLHKIGEYKDIKLNPIRSDIDLFTLNRVNMDRSFISFLNTPITNFHLAATFGYLEEMYAGYGGEILYRPHDSVFAIGAEGWHVYKRDGLSYLAADLYDGAYKTGHLNLYYDVPNSPITAFAKVGRFIGGDNGINTGAQMNLSNGVKIKGSLSFTNSDDKDIFDSRRNIQAGIEMSIPFGNLKFIPQGSEARINTSQMGRDDAAMINKPIDLYDVTEPMSYRHLGQNWQEVQN